MKEKMQRFMYGRYGADSFTKFLNVLVLIAIIISLFISHTAAGKLLYLAAFVLVILIYVRTFSKNIGKRSRENERYLFYSGKVKAFFTDKRNYFAMLRSYHVYKCPKCSQKIRIPRGKGKIAVRCPKCGNEFIKRS
jgi:DNA-directed RNA polymerase subunit RPC12/RpoP